MISLITTTEMIRVAKASPKVGNWTATSRARPSAIPAWVMFDHPVDGRESVRLTGPLAAEQ